MTVAYLTTKCTRGLVAPACALDKSFASMQARAALIGVALTQSSAGSTPAYYTASRWVLSKTFESLDEVEAWLDHVTGKSR